MEQSPATESAGEGLGKILLHYCRYVLRTEQSLSCMQACAGSHALCVVTEWDEFVALDYERIFASMSKPAFVFDGRNILDHDRLRSIGFIVYALGKPLEPFLQKQ